MVHRAGSLTWSYISMDEETTTSTGSPVDVERREEGCSRQRPELPAHIHDVIGISFGSGHNSLCPTVEERTSKDKYQSRISNQGRRIRIRLKKTYSFHPIAVFGCRIVIGVGVIRIVAKFLFTLDDVLLWELLDLILVLRPSDQGNNQPVFGSITCIKLTSLLKTPV
jgi:hypothetical protein